MCMEEAWANAFIETGRKEGWDGFSLGMGALDGWEGVVQSNNTSLILYFRAEQQEEL